MMGKTLTNREVLIVINALRHAIESEESYIDAHSRPFGPGFTRGFAKVVKRTQANVKRYQKMRRDLTEYINANT